MERKEMRTDTLYAVVDQPRHRPGDTSVEPRPAFVLDTGMDRTGTRVDPRRSTIPVMLLPRWSTLTVEQFAELGRERFIAWPFYRQLRATADRAALYRAADLFDADEAARERAEGRERPARLRTRRQWLESYDDLIDTVRFSWVRPYSVLGTWENHLSFQQWKLGLQIDDTEVEGDGRSQRAAALFAQRGVAVDPNAFFANEMVISYDDLFAAFSPVTG